MSVNSWFGDPFICQYSRTEIYDYSGSEISSTRTYSGSFPVYSDNWNPRSCPSSEPISPSLSSCSSTSSLDEHFIKVERPFHAYGREPFPQVKLEQEEFCPSDNWCFTSPTSSDDHSDRFGFSVETEFEERYQDFLQLLSETTGFDALGSPDLHCEDNIHPYPAELTVMRTKPPQMPRKIANTTRKALRGRASPGPQKNGRKRKEEEQYSERSQSSSSVSGDDDGSVASRKRAKTGSPVDTYTERRAKNNTAVRKSREKKRQESQRFLDEHEKLKKEVASVKSQNERLQSLLTEVEEGLLDTGKTKDELTALVQSAKKRLTSP